MKYLFLLFLYSVNALSLSVISDFDDTMKISNSGNLAGAGVRIPTHGFYLGAKEFYQELNRTNVSLYLVSAQPRFLHHNTQLSLLIHGVRYKKLITRSMIHYPKKFDFKLDIISKIIKNSNDDFILIGDDLGDDPKVYEEIKRRFPKQIKSIYIHRVKTRKIPTGQVYYWNHFEIAFLENFDYPKQFNLIIDSSSQRNHQFPKFADCPTKSTDFEPSLTSFKEYSIYESRLMSWCEQTLSGK